MRAVEEIADEHVQETDDGKQSGASKEYVLKCLEHQNSDHAHTQEGAGTKIANLRHHIAGKKMREMWARQAVEGATKLGRARGRTSDLSGWSPGDDGKIALLGSALLGSALLIEFS